MDGKVDTGVVESLIGNQRIGMSYNFGELGYRILLFFGGNFLLTFLLGKIGNKKDIKWDIMGKGVCVQILKREGLGGETRRSLVELMPFQVFSLTCNDNEYDLYE